MTGQLVTVFGGTGFLGRRAVRHLRDHGFAVRIASRHGGRAGEGSTLQSIFADIKKEGSIAAAVSGAYAVVNAVSLYRERGQERFEAVHVKAAERLARQAREAGVERLVHVSGIGANAQSKSAYIRSRGAGELAVQRAFPDAIIVRPAVMFGADDAFLTTLVTLLKRWPVYPLFGQGKARLQPVHVEDVADAIARAVKPGALSPATYEFGGPHVYLYKDLVRLIAERLNKKRILFPVGFPIWHGLAAIAEIMPGAQLSRGQVELMETDTAAAPGLPNLGTLGINPAPLEPVLEAIIASG
jgi:uncharacterized protein YbjT (DUF2867 family)